MWNGCDLKQERGARDGSLKKSKKQSIAGPVEIELAKKALEAE